MAGKIKKEDGTSISPQYLNDIEHDRRTPSSDHWIGEFSRVLEIDKDVLYYEVGQLPEDAREKDVDAENVKSAYKAFRRELKGK